MEEKSEFLPHPDVTLESTRYTESEMGIGGAPGPQPSKDAEVAPALAVWNLVTGATSTAITTTSSHVIFLRFIVFLLGIT
jgi:hypothetical protein